MPTTSPTTPDSPIQVPEIDIGEPVAVIPVASVAPLDGPPDGERINTFTLAPKNTDEDSSGNALGQLRHRVSGKPLTCLATAFSLGFILARALR